MLVASDYFEPEIIYTVKNDINAMAGNFSIN